EGGPCAGSGFPEVPGAGVFDEHEIAGIHRTTAGPHEIGQIDREELVSLLHCAILTASDRLQVLGRCAEILDRPDEPLGLVCLCFQKSSGRMRPGTLYEVARRSAPAVSTAMRNVSQSGSVAWRGTRSSRASI